MTMNKYGYVGLVASVLTVLAGVVSDASRAETLRERLKNRDKASSKDLAGTKIDGPGDYSFSMVHGGLTRMYRVHVPASYSPSRPTPLVLSFHGGGGNMNYQAEDQHYGQIAKSESAGYIVVFPNGYSKFDSGKFATWNGGNCCGKARDENIDDVGFVREIIKHVRGELNIDPNRIFANGMSNGGLFSYRLACEMSDTFKAIASVAGTDNTKTCAPKAPISILHIHAKDDDRVLYHGGAGREREAVTSFVSVPNTVTKWAGLNGCSTGPKRVLETPGAYCEAYTQCRSNVEVKLCVTDTGGHSWPGGSKVRGGTPGSTAISANDVMWDFFQSR
jgi:polyhydroxybutyrate depolymerase